MDAIRIRGGSGPLRGTVRISGAKNAALPILCATLLSDGGSYLRNVPALRDIETTAALLRFLGPLVSRFGRAKVSLPGGCQIGARPIDQHLKGLEAMGCSIRLERGYIVAEGPNGGGPLKGGGICLAVRRE